MNVDTFVRAMPGLTRAKATTYLPLMEAAQREFQITNLQRCRMWLAQVGHESVSLVYFEEIASGAAYEGRKDLGNTQVGDGKRFKGRGPIQLTGRANYTAAGKALGLDLVGHPELAAQPAHAFRVSAWWWATHGLNPVADSGDVVRATRIINGGLNGLADRQSRYARVQELGNAVLVEPTGSTPTPPTTQPEPDVPVPPEVFVLSPSVVTDTQSGTVHYLQVRSDGQLWRWWIATGKEPQHDIIPQGGKPGCDPASPPLLWINPANGTINVVAETHDGHQLQAWLPKGGQWGTRTL